MTGGAGKFSHISECVNQRWAEVSQQSGERRRKGRSLDARSDARRTLGPVVMTWKGYQSLFWDLTFVNRF